MSGGESSAAALEPRLAALEAQGLLRTLKGLLWRFSFAYVAPEPGSKPFVKVGDKVKKGQTVLIVEAMKTMNQIESPISGEVKSIFISDAQVVEYGESLLEIV